METEIVAGDHSDVPVIPKYVPPSCSQWQIRQEFSTYKLYQLGVKLRVSSHVVSLLVL